jgi:hypothetical protein
MIAAINSGFLDSWVTDLKDIKTSQTGRENGTIPFMFYPVAVTIGLGQQLIKPGRFINKESRESSIQNFSVDASQKIEMAASA